MKLQIKNVEQDVSVAKVLKELGNYLSRTGAEVSVDNRIVEGTKGEITVELLVNWSTLVVNSAAIVTVLYSLVNKYIKKDDQMSKTIIINNITITVNNITQETLNDIVNSSGTK